MRLKFITIGITLFLGAFSARAAQPVTVFFKGTCETTVVADNKLQCGPQPMTVVYSLLANGRVLFQVFVKKNLAVTFVGESDQQPSLTEYLMPVVRVRSNDGLMNSDGTIKNEQVFAAKGQCSMTVTPDGKIVKSLVCEAQSDMGKKYELKLTGDGQASTVVRLK